MTTIVTTISALRELASGASLGPDGESPRLFQAELESHLIILTPDDGLDTPRVVIAHPQVSSDGLIPAHLKERRREAFSRLASFAERASSRPLVLPRGWGPYKHDNLASFYVVPGPDHDWTRWITEVASGKRTDVFIWDFATSAKHIDLHQWAPPDSELNPPLDEVWAGAIDRAGAHFDQLKSPAELEVDLQLPVLPTGQSKAHTYEEWLQTVSGDQRTFLDAPTTKAIRLKGPAGSGKTLTITLKAIKETLTARNGSNDFRTLIVTHSWALASQISKSIDLMGIGQLPEVEVLPLLGVSELLAPQQPHEAAGLRLIGDDSQSGKQAQLDQILEVIDDFRGEDWITFRSKTSPELRERLDSEDLSERLALAWDLLIEFGSVIGASSIFIGAGYDLKYFQLSRARWMMPLTAKGDLEVVYELYRRFMDDLEERSLVTSDQVLADFLSYLETHAWNRSRRSRGYDLVFVDEFHLFSPLERQTLHYLTRDAGSFPRLFMALDPRQSASEAFIGLAADETRSLAQPASDESHEDITNLELTTVHRFTPQILNLVKHVHHTYPAFELGDQWDIDFTNVDSSQVDGPVPVLVTSPSPDEAETDIYSALQQVYNRGRVALAIVESRMWPRYADLATSLARSGKFHITTIAGRSDIEGLGYRKRGLVVGAAEYLAGLQFDSVLIAGLPDLSSPLILPNEKTRVLSHLYLAITRAEREVRIFVNDADGGTPDFLAQAAQLGTLQIQRSNLSSR